MKKDMRDPFEMKDKTGGMRVPTGYFETFQLKIEEEVNKEVVVMPTARASKRILPWVRRAMYVAAMLAGVLLVYKNAGQSVADETNVFSEYALTEDEVFSSSVTEYDLYEYLYAENE